MNFVPPWAKPAAILGLRISLLNIKLLSDHASYDEALKEINEIEVELEKLRGL